MLNNIEDRKKAYKFTLSFYKAMIAYEKETSRVKVDFGITTKKLQNLVNNKTEHLIGANAKNIKTLFTEILKQSLCFFNLEAVEKHNISVEDFLDLSKKMGIDSSLIEKAKGKHDDKHIQC